MTDIQTNRLDELLIISENKDVVKSSYKSGLEFGKTAQYCVQYIQFTDVEDEEWYDIWLNIGSKEPESVSFDGFVVGYNEGFSNQNVEVNEDYTDGFYRGTNEGYNHFYSSTQMRNKKYIDGYENGWIFGKYMGVLTGRINDSCQH